LRWSELVDVCSFLHKLISRFLNELTNNELEEGERGGGGPTEKKQLIVVLFFFLVLRIIIESREG
jgi:hypothetical protein